MMRTEKYSESQRAVSAKLTITEMRVSIKDEGFHASLSLLGWGWLPRWRLERFRAT